MQCRYYDSLFRGMSLKLKQKHIRFCNVKHVSSYSTLHASYLVNFRPASNSKSRDTVAGALNTFVHVVPGLELNGAATLLSFTPSMPAQGQIYLLFWPLRCTNHNFWNSFHATCLPRWAFGFRGVRPAYEAGTPCVYITYRTVGYRKGMPWLRRFVVGGRRGYGTGCSPSI